MELAQNRVLHVFNDEYYGLKFATEIRFEEYYKALKG